MPNDKYIKLSDVMQVECDLCLATFCKRDYQCIIATRLLGLPAAAAAPVVRCKDCKHRPAYRGPFNPEEQGFSLEFPNEEHNPCPCQCNDGWYSWMPPDDFFCAYGAKMD